MSPRAGRRAHRSKVETMYTKKLTTLRFSDARADLLANQGEGGGPLDCGRALLMAYVR